MIIKGKKNKAKNKDFLFFFQLIFHYFFFIPLLFTTIITNKPTHLFFKIIIFLYFKFHKSFQYK